MDVSQGAIVLELKVCDAYGQLQAGARDALAQIRNREYDRELLEEGYSRILHYGIAFFRKQCAVLTETADLQPEK